MKRHTLVPLLLLAVAAPAFADTCESSFQKKGNPCPAPPIPPR